MNERETAIEILSAFYQVGIRTGFNNRYSTAKDCALICVDQIIKQLDDDATQLSKMLFWHMVREKIDTLRLWEMEKEIDINDGT